jgi:uncharacterized SAM-binding protein YcdF (DUF218 family)
MYSLIGYLLTPSNLVTILFVAGVLSYPVKRFRRGSRFALVSAVVIYVIFATGPISFWLLGRLEYTHPYLKDISLAKDAKYVVVLAAYADNDQNLPLSSRVNSSAAFRLMEAQRIQRQIPGARILISGSSRVTNVMKDVLVSLGMNEANILIDNNALNTSQSAENIKGLAGDEEVILVTSAGHMPRSMMAFRKAGVEPIPAPTDYLTFKHYMAISYLPSPLHMRNSDLAVHEYIGILWYKIKGYI